MGIKYKQKVIETIIIILVITALLIFIKIYRINSINQKFEKNMEYIENYGEMVSYHQENSKYYFDYAPAGFFDESCFASVCEKEDVKAVLASDGNLMVNGTQITLFIWPCSREYGLYFRFMEQGEEQHVQIYIDKSLNCLSGDSSKETEYLNGLIDDNRKKIEHLLEQAENQWDGI